MVIQWNQAVLTANRVDKPTIGFATRDLAIVQTAIYDAVKRSNASSAFRMHTQEEGQSVARFIDQNFFQRLPGHGRLVVADPTPGATEAIRLGRLVSKTPRGRRSWR